MNVEAERENDAQDHEHGLTIIVNGREKTVTGKTLSFDEVLRLAFDPVPTGPN